MNVFRIHIRPYGGEASLKKTFEYCIKHSLLGVGWRTTVNNTKNWDLFLENACQTYKDPKDLNSCKYIKHNINPSDLVWTRDTIGKYYLGKIISGWEYFETDESQREDIDIANIFRVELTPIELPKVPGKIIASFRPSRTIQKIADQRTVEYTKYLWNKTTSSVYYQIDSDSASDFFNIIDDEETEDVVFMYLQYRGWIIQPNSRKKDTMGYEFIAYNPKEKAYAITQVKTGDSPINCDAYAEFDCTVFLFQPNSKYIGGNHAKIDKISKTTLLDFIKSNSEWLPKIIQYKLEISREISNS